MLINTIIKESTNGFSLKADILSEETGYSVNYYTNGALNKSAHYTSNLAEVESQINKWMAGIECLKG